MSTWGAIGRNARANARGASDLTGLKPPTGIATKMPLLMGGIRHGKRSPETILGIHEVATVPMAAIAWLALGFGFALYNSSKYQINVGYAIAFGGFTILMSSAWASYLAMRGLRMNSQPVAEPCHVGQNMVFKFEVQDLIGKRRKHLIVHAGAKQYAITIEPKSRVIIEFEAPARYRGSLSAPMIKLSTPYPMGIWNTHHLWIPLQKGIVYPKAEEGAPPLAGTQNDDGDGANSSQLSDHGDALVAMRAYRAGDAPNRVAWRIYAKSDGQTMATKQSEMGGQQMQDLWVEEDALGHLANPERRLSRLCAWLHQANATGRPYGFKAAGVSLEPSTGQDHLQRCLEALAKSAGAQDCVAFKEASK
jgi:uncharacterized protein (DUF58 family)